jgi:hypothetical protein
MSDALPDRTDDVFLKEILDSVNALRARHGVDPLTLDPDLVANAKNRAQVVSTYDMLNEDHRGATPGLGENLSWQATGSNEPAATTGASLGWYGEIVDHDFAASKQFDNRWATGHFTQLVWKGSTKFGAGRAFGKKGDNSPWYETYIVANFSPAGNMAGDYATNVLAPTKGRDNAATLRWTSFDGVTWSPVTLLSEHLSSTGPAAAAFSDTLYCLHRGDADASISYTTWTSDTKIPGTTDHSPAAAVYQDKLYCVYRGTGTDATLRYTRFDGMTWAESTPIAAQTAAGPALAVYQDKLYCVHRGTGTDGRLWVTTFDGTTWSTDTRLTADCQTATAPTLAVYKDKLYCLHRGKDDAGIWFTSFDGTTWAPDSRIAQLATPSAPALAVYQNKLYCVCRATDDTLRFFSYDGTSWTATTKIPNATSTANPALAVHHERLYCVHRK